MPTTPIPRIFPYCQNCPDHSHREREVLLLPLSTETGADLLYQLGKQETGKAGTLKSSWQKADVFLLLSALCHLRSLHPKSHCQVSALSWFIFQALTHASIYEESDLWQDKLYFCSQNKTAEGHHLLQPACSPYVKPLLSWPDKTLTDVDEDNHPSNNSKKRSPSTAGLRGFRQRFAKIILNSSGLPFVTTDYWESCSLLIWLATV